VAAGVVGRDESKVEPDISEEFVERVAEKLQARYATDAEQTVRDAKGNGLRRELFSELRNGFFEDIDDIRGGFLAERRKELEVELALDSPGSA